MPKTYEQYQVKYKAFFEAQAAYAPNDKIDWAGIAKSFIKEMEDSKKRMDVQHREEELKNLSADNIGREISLLLSRLEVNKFPIALESLITNSGEDLLKTMVTMLVTEIKKRRTE